MMKKQQQWMMFKQVFSMTNSSSSSSSSISVSFNNVLLRLLRRPFCSTTTTTTTVPAVSNNKKQHELNMLLEKKVPLLIVPYDHITPKEYVLCPPNNRVWNDRGDHYYVCDGTFGFINLFFDDDNDDQLIINKKKKKKKEVYDVYVPEIARRKICGSSEGWLVTVDWNGEFQLLNPVTRAIVHLQPFTTLSTVFPPYHPESIEKVVTVTTTTTTNSTTLPAAVANTVMVMAIYGEGNLSFCRTSSSTGNGTTDETTAATAWIRIPFKFPNSDRPLIPDQPENPSDSDEEEYRKCVSYEVIDGVNHLVTMLSSWVDVTFYKGNFYTVDRYGMVGVVKGLDGPSLPFVQILIDLQQSLELHEYWLDTCYLVESSSSPGGGDLLVVMRNMGKETTKVYKTKEEEEEIFERPYRTNGFRVFKLDLNNGPPSWEEVTDLGEDCALFVGNNRSVSLSASKIPGCRGNCIYFTDGHEKHCFPNGGHDIGVYKLEDASFEKLDYETCSSQLIMPPPIWYVPN